MDRTRREKMSGRPVRAVETAYEIVASLVSKNGVGVTELAEDIGVAKSVAYNHLSTLHNLGFIVKDGDQYYLSFKFLDIGDRIRRENILYRSARLQVDDLANETGEFAHLMVYERGLAYNLHRARGKNAVATTSRVGKPNYLHQTAAGKAILANLDEKEVRRIADIHGLPASTKNTITTTDTLLTELQQIRDDGVATADEECIMGARAVGAAVCDGSGEVLGAISVSGPLTRLTKDAISGEISDIVMQASNNVEMMIISEHHDGDTLS